MLMWIPTCCRPGPVHSRATSRHSLCDVILGDRLLIRAVRGITPAVLDQQGRAGGLMSSSLHRKLHFCSQAKVASKSHYSPAVRFWNKQYPPLTNVGRLWLYLLNLSTLPATVTGTNTIQSKPLLEPLLVFKSTSYQLFTVVSCLVKKWLRLLSNFIKNGGSY